MLHIFLQITHCLLLKSITSNIGRKFCVTHKPANLKCTFFWYLLSLNYVYKRVKCCVLLYVQSLWNSYSGNYSSSGHPIGEHQTSGQGSSSVQWHEDNQINIMPQNKRSLHADEACYNISKKAKTMPGYKKYFVNYFNLIN